MNVREYRFDERLRMSAGVSHGATVGEILLGNVPGALRIRRANEHEDRHGTDWWVEHLSGRRLSVDCKICSKDYAALGRDVLPLETWSICERQVIGWTRNPQKRTDYILWFWADTGRWCLVPFVMLCKVFQVNLIGWTKSYEVRQQYTPDGINGGYHSECVFVPRKVVWRAIYELYGGVTSI